MSKRQFSFSITLLKSALQNVSNYFKGILRLFRKIHVKIGGGGAVCVKLRKELLHSLNFL
jgi:hypothetical protein